MDHLEEIHSIKGKKILLKVETSHHHPDYRKYENLRFEIWEEPEDRMPGPRNMVCENYFNDGSALFIAVYIEDEKGLIPENEENFVGFSYGFVGVADKKIGFRDPKNLVFYSQYTGVRKEVEEYGLGIQIKEFQRKILIETFGVKTASCTFDPLTGVNAYRNIHHFGMEVAAYYEAHYGEFGGRLNRKDIPCDRFHILWHLQQAVSRPEVDIKALLEGKKIVLSSTIHEIEGKSGMMPIEIAQDPVLDLLGNRLLLEIPFDFYTMLRETDVSDEKTRSIPLDWRLKTRRAFQTCFEQGYSVIDFQTVMWEERQRDFYLLAKSNP